MFFSFKRKNNQRQHNKNLKAVETAEVWAKRCISLQNKAASFLHAKSERLSFRTKRLIVIAFSVISFSSCVYLLTKSFFGSRNINLSIAPIRVSEQVVQNEDRHVSRSRGVSKNEFEKVKKFRAYIDSLATSNSGKRVYDSIRMNRPGLIDSLSIIENFYKSQLLNK